MKLVATKSFTYNTRRLQAGDHFDTKTERDGILLIAVRKARSGEPREEQKVPEPKKELLDKLATGGVFPAPKPVESVEPVVVEEPVEKTEGAPKADEIVVTIDSANTDPKIEKIVADVMEDSKPERKPRAKKDDAEEATTEEKPARKTRGRKPATK